MSGHICFEKSADSAYSTHNGSQTTMSGKGKVHFFESIGIILIIYEVKPSIQESAYESAVSSQSIMDNPLWNFLQKNIFCTRILHNFPRYSFKQYLEVIYL